jgi:GntR family transcriptional regulator
MTDTFDIPTRDKAAEGILWLIQSKGLSGGDRLPAERVLCERLGVSRTALRGAIAQLTSAHVLESRVGSGTYVCPSKPVSVFQSAGAFSEAVRNAGQVPSALVLSQGCLPAG